MRSPETESDVIRAPANAGYHRSAASNARKAFATHPGPPQFLYLAGVIFQKSAAEAEAADALQEYAKLKPDEGRAFFLLGTIHEKAGRNSTQ